MIGKRITYFRKKNGMSSKELAEKADVSASYVSQVEREKITPSVDVLRRFSKALKVPVFMLLAEDEEEKELTREKERNIIKFPNIDLTYEIVTSNPNNVVGVLIGRLGPGHSSSETPLFHEGEECILVQSGTLKVELAGKEYILNSGDALYMKSTFPHRFINLGEDVCVFQLIITPPSFSGIHGQGNGQI